MKTTLKAMKTGETRNFSSNPCYPVPVAKVSENGFRFPDGTVETLDGAARRLRPVGVEIYG